MGLEGGPIVQAIRGEGYQRTTKIRVALRQGAHDTRQHPGAGGTKETTTWQNYAIHEVCSGETKATNRINSKEQSATIGPITGK